VTPELLARLLARRACGATVALATRLSDGFQLLLPDPAAPGALCEAADAVLATDEARTVKVGAETWFVQIEAPAPRLLIVGAVHIAQTLAPMAEMAGYAATVIDPRRGFATAERFPKARLVLAWPDEALATLAPDERTAVVTLTHDPKLDDPALDAALRAGVFFIGALGSRKTHASRLERLAARGHTPEDLARIRGPVGLAIGARSAPEIALSVLAELVAVRRGAALAKREKENQVRGC
jgi:xanthine dehydrogenase accessory factor